jgi:hypothetical protein
MHGHYGRQIFHIYRVKSPSFLWKLCKWNNYNVITLYKLYKFSLLLSINNECSIISDTENLTKFTKTSGKLMGLIKLLNWIKNFEIWDWCDDVNRKRTYRETIERKSGNRNQINRFILGRFSKNLDICIKWETGLPLISTAPSPRAGPTRGLSAPGVFNRCTNVSHYRYATVLVQAGKHIKFVVRWLNKHT